MKRIGSLLFILTLVSIFSCFAQRPNPARQWFMYRGNYAGGVLDNANLPESWDVETGRNIAWKTEIPRLGHSSPIVWGDAVFVTTAANREDSEGVM